MVDFLAEVMEPATQLERELGVPAGFLDRLAREDDWSFVIKAHALVEAAMTHALVVHTGNDKARDFYSRLELSGAKTGKLAFAETLDLLSSEERGFIRSLSEVRNSFVHDVRNVDADLTVHFANMPKDKRRQYAKTMCFVDFSKTTAAVSEQEALESLLKRPKQAIWNGVAYIAAILQLRADSARALRLVQEYQAKLAEHLRPNNSLERSRER